MIYHRAHKIAGGGKVSALCHKTPHAIDLRHSSWTLRDQDVTCPRCRKIIHTQVKETP